MSTQIHDLGYRAYAGERAGVAWAVRSLAVHSMRRILGLKRAGKHKIVPAITIGFAFLPAIVMIGIAAFVPAVNEFDIIRLGDYFGFISFALFLFTAAAAPGVLTTDRTSGMLALYLASPLNRTTYVLAKFIGIFSVMLLVTVAPIVFLQVAFTLVGSGPGGIVDFVASIARAIVAGGILAAALTGLGMFISSFPKRWGIASVAIVATMLIPIIVAAILTEGADAPDWVMFLSPPDILGKAWEHLIGDPVNNSLALDRLDSTLVVLAAIAYAAVFVGLTWWRYQHIEVDR